MREQERGKVFREACGRERVVFLDRDGTVNQEVGFLTRVEDLELIPRAAEAIRLLNRSGFRVVILSNQSGVARGFLDEETLRAIHRALLERLEIQGARVEGIYYCPHHPEAPLAVYRRRCHCRKPETGLVRQAAQDLGIRPEGAYVVGDRLLDMELAHRIGGTGVLVLTGYGRQELARRDGRPQGEPDHVAADLYHAAVWILSREGKADVVGRS